MFSFRRPRLLDERTMERIHAAAVSILLENGIAIDHGGALERAQKAGLRVVEDRVFPDRGAVDELVSESMRLGRANAPEEEPPSSEIRLTCWAGPAYYHDFETDEIMGFTMESLVTHTRFLDRVIEEGLVSAGNTPGTPTDVPADLQSIARYKIAAENCRHGHQPGPISNSRELPYLMEMAEVLGHRRSGVHFFIYSPFRLSTEYFDALFSDSRLTSVATSNMTSVGGSTPIHLPHALAVAAAEAMGAAIALRKITERPVTWRLYVCPIDLRYLVLSIGAPEEILFHLASDELTAFYQGREPGPPAGLFHTQAKVPNVQAAAEQMCQMTFAALFGTRQFGGGGLSLDEIWSPEQLILQCEMRDHVSRLIRGVDLEFDLATAIREAAAGRVEGGFVGLESTAKQCREVYWTPRLFERRSLSGWLAAGKPDPREDAKGVVREYMAKGSDFELPEAQRRELEAIYRRAERELG